MANKRTRNTKYAKEFGRRLKARMEEFEMTQTELSKLTGIAQPDISVYISGKIVPSAITVVKLARALNMTTDELINFEV